MTDHTLSFIGGGNMAHSLIGGLIADGWPATRIHVADTSAEQRSHLAERFAVHTHADNSTAIAAADVVVLAVKPQVMHSVASGISAVVQQRQPLIISIAAGIRSSDLDRWLGGQTALVRCMPNTPALVQSGATALVANSRVSDAQRDLAESILRAVGIAQWLDDEQLMDAVTALSGSGPAYYFLIMEAMQAAAQELGLPEQTAQLLTLQTAFGAAKMALESNEDAATLRRRVTSPGGTTERALQTLEDGQLRGLISSALRAARDRSRELADQLGQ